MGGVPVKHRTSSKVGRSRSHLALKKKSFVYCRRCNAQILPHQICFNCGYFKGRQVIDVLAKLSKKEKKKKEKELKEKINE